MSTIDKSGYSSTGVGTGSSAAPAARKPAFGAAGSGGTASSVESSIETSFEKARELPISTAAMGVALRVRGVGPGWREAINDFLKSRGDATLDRVLNDLHRILASGSKISSSTDAEVLTQSTRIGDDISLILEILHQAGSGDVAKERAANDVLSALSNYERTFAKHRPLAPASKYANMCDFLASTVRSRADVSINIRMEEATTLLNSTKSRLLKAQSEKLRNDKRLKELTADPSKPKTDTQQSIVGQRAAIKWITPTGRRVWYSGNIAEWNAATRMHKMSYDDGEVKWYPDLTDAGRRKVEITFHTAVPTGTATVDPAALLDAAMATTEGQNLMKARTELARLLDQLPKLEQALATRVSLLQLAQRAAEFVYKQLPVNSSGEMADALMAVSQQLRSAINTFVAARPVSNDGAQFEYAAQQRHLQWACARCVVAAVSHAPDVVQDVFRRTVEPLGLGTINEMVDRAPEDGRIKGADKAAGARAPVPAPVAKPPRPSNQRKRGRQRDEEEKTVGDEEFLDKLLASPPVTASASASFGSSAAPPRPSAYDEGDSDMGAGAAGAGGVVEGIPVASVPPTAASTMGPPPSEAPSAAPAAVPPAPVAEAPQPQVVDTSDAPDAPPKKKAGGGGGFLGWLFG